MARLPRFNFINIPQYIVLVSKRNQCCFFDDDDYEFYLKSLAISARQYMCDIHAYVLLPDKIQIIATPKIPGAISSMMQSLGRRYVQHANHKYKRSGSLWGERYKSSLIDSNGYLLSCYRYLELRPLHLELVDSLESYPWSSFHHHSGLKPDELITDHPVYLDLGESDVDRCNAYNRLFRFSFDIGLRDYIAEIVSVGQILGGDHFKDQIEQIANRRVRPLKRGRPRKNDTLSDEDKKEVQESPEENYEISNCKQLRSDNSTEKESVHSDNDES